MGLQVDEKTDPGPSYSCAVWDKGRWWWIWVGTVGECFLFSDTVLNLCGMAGHHIVSVSPSFRTSVVFHHSNSILHFFQTGWSTQISNWIWVEGVEGVVQEPQCREWSVLYTKLYSPLTQCLSVMSVNQSICSTKCFTWLKQEKRKENKRMPSHHPFSSYTYRCRGMHIWPLVWS